MKNNSQNTKGFTILETLVAIAVLSVAVGGAFSMAQKSISSSAFSRDQTTAFFLASEGLELVRQVRDNVTIYNVANAASVDWLQPFKTACSQNPLAVTCQFDVNPLSTNLSYVTTGGGTTASAGDIKVCNGDSKGCRLMIENFCSANMGPAFCADFGYDKRLTAVSLTSTAGSIFYRKITIVESSTDVGGVTKREAIVTSTVSWFSETFTLVETLTNWN